MEDLERYGDYNDIEDDMPKGKNPLGIILKILVGIICISVVGVLAFRIILFNNYPDSMKSLYFDSTLTEHYKSNEGNISVKTQSLRAPYDNPDEGNFFCGNLFVISDISQLQVSLRFNTALADSLKEKYGAEVDIDNSDIFHFRLVRNPRSEDGAPEEIGSLEVTETDSMFYYRYYKLVFCGVDFGLDEGEDKVNWIRLEITIDGVDAEEPFMVAIYENNEAYSTFEDYVISDKEKPE